MLRIPLARYILFAMFLHVLSRPAAGLVISLALAPLLAAGAGPEEELRFWLENALAHHGFTLEEAALAAGRSPEETARLAAGWGIEARRPPPLARGGPLKLLPYPGGRHPRIGFLDGAVDPRRETKASLFLPWEGGGYLVLDLPEAVFDGRDLLYLAHTHIPTVWDARGVKLPLLEWRRRPDGSLDSHRLLPDGVAFGMRMVPRPDGADLDLWIRNGGDTVLRALRAQVCLLLRGAAGFEAQTNDNKLKVKLRGLEGQGGEAMVCRSGTGRRWVALAFEGGRAWGNPPCPCLHSDPSFPACPPGATVRARGWIRVGEGQLGAEGLDPAAAAALLPRAEAALAAAGPLRAGAAAVEVEADDSMVIGGGIGPGAARGQEGKLRASALVLERGEERLALVACDVLMVARDVLDEAARRIERDHAIPFDRILINATHTHHAPTTVSIHGYRRDEGFCARLKEAAVLAVGEALARARRGGPCELVFGRGTEATVGQNSRLLLSDGTVFWVGSRGDAVRPTGPFDPDLPVLGLLRAGGGAGGGLEGLLFNHSTHCIGVREPGKRSPGFYGLAAQDLEGELGGTAVFLAGAFGSTHNLSLSGGEAAERIGEAVRRALARAEPREAAPLRGLRREVRFRVRKFDEAAEDAQVQAYCRKRLSRPESVIDVFRAMRAELAPRRGEERSTWVQALRIGDVAVVGAPGELFTALGLEIKRRSPFRHTLVAGVANDYVGYIPDREAYGLGGYQVWTGLHSFVEQGTGESIVEEALALLEELALE